MYGPEALFEITVPVASVQRSRPGPSAYQTTRSAATGSAGVAVGRPRLDPLRLAEPAAPEVAEEPGLDERRLRAPEAGDEALVAADPDAVVRELEPRHRRELEALAAAAVEALERVRRGLARDGRIRKRRELDVDAVVARARRAQPLVDGREGVIVPGPDGSRRQRDEVDVTRARDEVAERHRAGEDEPGHEPGERRVDELEVRARELGGLGRESAHAEEARRSRESLPKLVPDRY